MADVFQTVTPPDLPALAQVDGSELVAVWRNGRLAKMPQKDLRGTKTFSGAGTPPYDPSRLFTLQVSLNDRWRDTKTRDEYKLIALDPVAWEFDGNVGGGKGEKGEPGSGISPKGQFATSADLPSMGLPGDLYVATADDTAVPPAFLAGDGAMYVATGGTFGPGNRYQNIGAFRGPPGTPGAKTVDALEDATDGFKALNVTDPSAPGNPVGDKIAVAAKLATPSGISDADETAGFNLTKAFLGVDRGGRLGFGPGWRAGHAIHQAPTDQHIGDARATAIYSRETTGSGANGPGNADYGLLVSSTKTNYLTSASPGEIDGMYVVAKQGSKDDVAGILVDVRKLHNLDANDSGGSLAIETTVARMSNTNAERTRVQAAWNFAESLGGASSGKGYGAWIEAQVGVCYSAFHAGNLSPGAFENVLTFHGSRSPTDVITRIDAAGRYYASAGSPSLPGLSFQSDPDTGFTRLSANAIGVVTGSATRLVVDSAGNTYPGADNVYSLGAPGNRFANAYFASNPTITSDARLKTDIEDTVLGLDFICDLKPVQFRAADGGARMIEREVETWAEEDSGVFDDVLIFDDAGEPVWSKNGEPVLGVDGEPLLDDDGDPVTKRVQQKIAVPRKHRVKKISTESVHVDAEGQRVHLGFLAQDIREALLAHGQTNSAMWTLEDPADPDSRQGIRPDHLLAPLVAAVQTLSAQKTEQDALIQALSDRVAAFEKQDDRA